MTTENRSCSFCGKPEHEVKNLIEEGKYTEADDKIKIYSKLTFDNDHLCYYHYLSTISKFYQNNY